MRHDVSWRPLRHHSAAMHARARPHAHHMIGSADGDLSPCRSLTVVTHLDHAGKPSSPVAVPTVPSSPDMC